MNLPLMGMGTWGLGGKYEADPSTEKQSMEILSYGLKLGLRMIDTAELYGRGLGEKIVGKVIKDYPREDMFIISKVWIENLAYDDVIKSAKGSLERLDTDYIDLYLIHWSLENEPKKKVPFSETTEAMEYLVEQGVIKNIGLSNASVGLMEEAIGCLKTNKLAANQIEYNLLNQSADLDIIPFCRAKDIKIIAHRPLAKGTLIKSINPTVDALSKKYNKTSIQIALNWIMSQGISVIPKSDNLKHLEENIGALGWKMEREDINLLKKALGK